MQVLSVTFSPDYHAVKASYSGNIANEYRYIWVSVGLYPFLANPLCL